MLEYYDSLPVAANRIRLDQGWVRLMCEKNRITPHAVKFEGKWFLPKDWNILPPWERGEIRNYIEGYESLRDAATRLNRHHIYLGSRAKKGLLKTEDGEVATKMGGVWFVPVGANLELVKKEFVMPADKRAYMREKKRESRARIKAGIKG